MKELRAILTTRDAECMGLFLGPVTFLYGLMTLLTDFNGFVAALLPVAVVGWTMLVVGLAKTYGLLARRYAVNLAGTAVAIGCWGALAVAVVLYTGGQAPTAVLYVWVALWSGWSLARVLRDHTRWLRRRPVLLHPGNGHDEAHRVA